MTVIPVPKLEVDWTAAISDPVDSLAFDDVAPGGEDGPRITAFTVRMGRNRQLDRIEQGTGQFTVADLARVLDPTNGAAPYVHVQRPLARIRATVTWDGLPRPLFGGYLRAMSYSRPDLDNRTATFNAVDIFTVLNRDPLPSSPWDVEVAADKPRHLWRLGSGLAKIADSGTHPTAGDNYYVGGGSDLAAGGSGSSGTFDGVTSFVHFPQGAITTAQWTMALPIQMNGADIGSYGSTIYSQSYANIFVGVHGYLNALSPEWAGFPHFEVVDATTGANVDITGLARVADGHPHVLHVAYTGANILLYIDGAGPTVGAVGGISPNGPVAIGSYGAQTPPYFGWKGQIGDVAVWDSVLTADRIAAQADAFLHGWTRDSPGQRINRLLDHEHFPAIDRSLETGVCRLGPATLGSSTLTHCADAADADGGIFFAGPDNTATFYARDHLVTNARSITPQFTLTDTAPGIAFDLPLETPIDDANLWNKATVTSSGGGAQTADDLVAQARDSVRAAPSRDGSMLYDDDERLSSAHRLLARGGDDDRLNTITIIPERDPEVLFPLVLDVAMWDRITVEVAPDYTQDLIVEGKTHTVTIGADPAWVTTLSVSAAEDVSDYMVLDDASAPGLGFARIL